MAHANDVGSIGFEFISDLGLELTKGDFDIPTFPDNAIRIKSILEDPAVTAEQVARVVGSDPIFSVRLLQIANSVMICRAGPQIDNIQMAITRMGLRAVYNTVMSIAVKQLLNTNTTAKLRPYLKELWQHSIQVAAFSHVIAKRQTRLKPDVAMLAGLLHDIGKYYILMRSEHYPDLFNHPEALKQIMDDWHTGVGRSILEAWGFSEEMALTADEHNEVDRTHTGPADITDVVLIANLLSHCDGQSENLEVELDKLNAAKCLNLTTEIAMGILDESQEEIQSIIHAFDG